MELQGSNSVQLVTSAQPPNSQCLNDDDASEARHSRTRPNLTGHTLADRYLLTRKIGEGGMGEVYEARHQALGRRVAIKLLQSPFLFARHDFLQFFIVFPYLQF